jgi:hypothetical protein
MRNDPQTQTLHANVFSFLRRLPVQAQNILQYSLQTTSQLDKALVLATASSFPVGKDESFRTWFVKEYLHTTLAHEGDLPLGWDDLFRGLVAATRGDVLTVIEIYGKFQK